MGARERLPQAVDGAGETSNLLGQLLGISLLRGKKPPHGLQLILNNLQLVDRLLLRRLQTLGFLDQLLGGLGGPRLQLAGRRDAILFGRRAGLGAPQNDRTNPYHQDDERSGGKRNWLRADTSDDVGL